MATPLTLAIETSGPRGGIALGRGDGEILWQQDFPTGPAAGGQLFVALEECIRAEPPPARILVGLGPGSYAGVRMAIAAATGIGLALDLEPMGLPSVCGYDVPAPAFHAVGDARRGAYYYTAVVGSRCQRGPEILDEDELRARLTTQPGWPVFSVEPLANFPAAHRVVATAARLLTAPVEHPLRNLEPIYLREPHITQPRTRVP